MKKKVAQAPAPAEYDWNSFARSAGGIVGDMFGGPSAASPHGAASEAHTEQASASVGGAFGMLLNPMRALGDLGHAVQQEGLGALSDLGGAMDRQDAQRDLASRFNVDVSANPMMPWGSGENDITQDQFIALSRQYSDIRRGNTNLKLDFAEEGSDPKNIPQLEERTMQDIGDIMQTQVGRDLIGELTNGKRPTMISEQSVNDAEGGSYYKDYDVETPTGTEVRKKWFNYAQYAPGENHFPGKGDYRSDATLFHELSHAYHAMKGDFAAGEVANYASGDGGEIDRSEYQSVGIGGFELERYSENAYRDSRGLLSSGSRTLGGSDADMKRRDRYTHD